MSVNTTINIKPGLRAQLFDVSLLFNISMSKIIGILIYKIMHSINSRPCLFETVKYQKDDKLIKWKKLHISYDKDVYEVANDLRKILKKSVSRIVAEGIVEFLDEIINDLSVKKKYTDNYRPSYLFAANKFKKIYYFTVFWGIPPYYILKI